MSARRALAAAVAASAVGSGLAAPAAEAHPREPALASAPAPAPAARAAARVPLARLVGQRLVVGFAGTRPGADLLRRVRRGEVGGVILFARNVRSAAQVRRLTAALQRAARAGGNPPLLVTVDQEGGLVRRFAGAPPSRSAREMGTGAPAATRREGRATGAFLRRAGVHVDFAPVLDVPTSRNAFVWRERRAFGLRAGTVARHGVAFAEGLRAGGAAATAKHFPGLGDATRNTDEARQRLTPTAAERRAALLPFRRAIDAGVELVMMANAAFPAYDRAARPAGLSPPTIALLRRLGFGGVVVTDSLDAVAARAAGRDRAVRAAHAGADVLLFASPAAGEHRRLVRAARRGRLRRSQLERSYERIVALKRRLAARSRRQPRVSSTGRSAGARPPRARASATR